MLYVLIDTELKMSRIRDYETFVNISIDEFFAQTFLLNDDL